MPIITNKTTLVDTPQTNKPFDFLFIDDTVAIHRYLKILIRIKQLPIIPHFCCGAKEALNYLGSLYLKNIFPQVIVTDVDMPIMNGYEFIAEYTKQFCQEHPKTLLYTCSSSLIAQRKFTVAQSNSAQLIGFIPKPFNQESFQQKIVPHLAEAA